MQSILDSCTLRLASRELKAGSKGSQAAAVTLDRITVGGIVERSVPALIAPPDQLKVSLLGMSFLDRLESWEVPGGKLSMRAH